MQDGGNRIPSFRSNVCNCIGRRRGLISCLKCSALYNGIYLYYSRKLFICQGGKFRIWPDGVAHRLHQGNRLQFLVTVKFIEARTKGIELERTVAPFNDVEGGGVQ